VALLNIISRASEGTRQRRNLYSALTMPCIGYYEKYISSVFLSNPMMFENAFVRPELDIIDNSPRREKCMNRSFAIQAFRYLSIYHTWECNFFPLSILCRIID
jgi:hypothetical protein